MGSCEHGNELSWARYIPSTPSHPISLRSIPVLFSNLYLGLPNGLFLAGFQTKIFYSFLISRIRATCPAHLIFLDLITKIIFYEAYKILSYLIVQSSPTSCHFFPLRSEYSLSTLFSSTSRCFPWLCEIKFHTHTKLQVKWWFCVF